MWEKRKIILVALSIQIIVQWHITAAVPVTCQLRAVNN
jgi:hypothetical protein